MMGHSRLRSGLDGGPFRATGLRLGRKGAERRRKVEASSMLTMGCYDVDV